MKKLALIPILAASALLPGCFKVSSESAVKNDGTATVKLAVSYKTEVMEMMKEQIDQAIEMMGDKQPQLARVKEQFEKTEAAFDEKKAAAEWKKYGLDVTKSASSDKDGWKGFEIEGGVKNLGDYHAKQAESRKSKKEADQMGPDPTPYMVPRLPHFYKTDQPNVAKVVFAWRDPSPQQKALENMSDEMREQVEQQLEGARTHMSLDDLKIEMKVKLPGKILSVSNCKQDGDTLVFLLQGADLSADSVSKMGQLPSATLEVDPKEFKIPLEDEPKAESQPASRKAKPMKAEDDEKKNKDDEKDKEKEKDK